MADYRVDSIGRRYPASKNKTPRPVAERLWEKVEITDSCWLWTGSRTADGYGEISEGGPKSGRRRFYVHRLAWEILVGPIPEDMTIDHVAERCGNRHCVNVAHMEVVTRAENGRRGGVLGGRPRRTAGG